MRDFMQKPVIAITLGDPGGIGPEVVVKALANKQVYKCCTPIIIGVQKALYKTKKISPSYKIEIINHLSDIKNMSKKAYLFNPQNLKLKNIILGKPNPIQAKAAIEFLKDAAVFALNKEIDAVVTAPVNKHAINEAGIKFRGQTEFLAACTNTHKYAMLLTSEKTRIIPLTRHVQVKNINKLIKKQYIIDTIELIDQNSFLFGIHKPSIAVLGLNPHCGDGGAIGNEEIMEIIPAINETLKSGINVHGPFSADVFFASSEYKKYDFILAMYHDQGLIPFKMLSFGKGVNVTIGLPIIRTSPDHGTAYDIAGQGIANEGSLIEAIKMASKMAIIKQSLHKQ
ncbi:MAG: 4-hydroxythreonine-4-phosphate dehydrogenase PdxA [bacterium]|nr:4-hydroxythreonine-4-phosphate dehydrogenase PdxA [bacterium]